MPPDAPAHPTQLGNYDVVSKIADGGMGTVYKARHRFSGDVVAVKVIAPTTAKNPILLQRFEREFLAAKVLDHPNVVKAIEYCGAGPHPFLVMEYVDGESVGQRIERAGAIPEDEAVRVIAQVCDGLQRAHKQGLVHRDVKPDNILITRDGAAKLTDLGLVKDIDADLNLTKTGRGLGTPHFMAPEQFRNAKTVDVRGDIYSLGATLYAMVTGCIPFEKANPLDCWLKKVRNEFPPPRELRPSISDRIDWAVRRAMSAEPTARPTSCREFLEDLTGQSRHAGTGLAPALTGGADLWYMVYRDEFGQTHTVKGTTEGIRTALGEGLLGDAAAILVGRSKTGQFIPLQSVPEFRDLVVAPAALGEPGRSSSVVPRSSGTVSRPVPRSGTVRQPAAAEAVELGTPPPAGDGSVSGRSGRGVPLTTARPSGRMGVPTPRATPTGTPRPQSPLQVVLPTLDGSPDPNAETVLHSPATPLPTPLPGLRRTRTPVPVEEPQAKGFDWTPVLAVTVAILSALVGYLLINR